MGFKLKGEPYDKDDMNISVYRKNLDDGSAAKSNHTGIVLQTGLSPEMEGAAIEHEKVHQYQQRRGDLDYDENNFYWKGKTYPRKNLNEHNAKLPWEVEAYKESNKILNGKQTNKQMKEKFQLRNGEGNGAPFANLTSKGLMGPSLDTDPINPVKPSEIATTGSKEAQQQKADLAKIGVEKEVKLKPNELGVYSGDKDLGVKKYTSFYKTSDPKLKEKGNAFWSSLSEPEKQEIRDRKSRYEKAPIKMDKIPAKPIKTSSSLDIKRVPLKTPGGKPSREIEPVFKTKKEIKEHVFNQYGGISRDRLSLYKKASTNRRIPASFNTGRGDIFGKVATAVAGKKQVFKNADVEKKVKAAYDEQNRRRKAKKYADKKGLTFLDSGESVAQLRKKGRISQYENKAKQTKITTGIFSHNRVKKNNKST
jgi:hypothetical protein